jgi:hypothetical protein
MPNFFNRGANQRKKNTKQLNSNGARPKNKVVSEAYPISWYALLWSQAWGWLLYGGDGFVYYFKTWFPWFMDYFFEGTVDPILMQRRYEKKKTLDFQYEIRDRKKIIQGNFDNDKKRISQKKELCLNWQTRSVEELERKRTIDIAVGSGSRYTDDLPNKPGWTIREGTSHYQGINDLCEDLGCWDPNTKRKYQHSVVNHQLTIPDDNKDLKTEIRELQKEVGVLTRDLTMCTQYMESQDQNRWHDESYGRPTPKSKLSPQLQLPSQPWDHSYHPSGLDVPFPVMEEDGLPFQKPIYDTAMDVLTWPGNILDKTHPHWKQKPPPGPIRGLLAIMGNGLITIACLILLMMIMFVIGHLVVSVFGVSSTSLQKIKDAVVPKRNVVDQEFSSEKVHPKKRKTMMQKVFGIFQAKEKKIIENEGSLIYFLKKWWNTSAELKEEYDQKRFFAVNRINRGGARFALAKELDQSLILLDPIFLIIHMFKLHKILVLHQERKPVAESIGKSIKEIKKSVQLYSLYFGLAMGTIMTPISTIHSRNSPSYLVIDARERSIGISETSNHIEKIQLGDKILVLGSKRTPVLKKEALESLEYLNIPKNSKFGVSRTKTKRLKAKMRRFSDLPKLDKLNDSQDLQILVPQSTSSRLRIRTK